MACHPSADTQDNDSSAMMGGSASICRTAGEIAAGVGDLEFRHSKAAGLITLEKMNIGLLSCLASQKEPAGW
jgi:hypothetical protein